jgi:hypothetical protein
MSGLAHASLVGPNAKHIAEGFLDHWLATAIRSSAHLWAERFERPVTDLFEMQDEIVARIANTLNAQTDRRRSAARRPSADAHSALHVAGQRLRCEDLN